VTALLRKDSKGPADKKNVINGIHSTDKLVIALLAAGASRRFEGIKLVEPIDAIDAAGKVKRQPLLLHSLDKLQSLANKLESTSVHCEVVVVLGAHHRALTALLPTGVRIITNSEWQRGLSSSIKVAVTSAIQLNATALMVTLADHIGVDDSAYELIARRWLSEHKTCCASYQHSVGVPAIFNAELFSQLQLLTGDKGAKSLLKQLDLQDKLTVVEVPGIAVDIDQREDVVVWHHAIKKQLS
jgi:molybdenum cofactor cytidylyltransferase